LKKLLKIFKRQNQNGVSFYSDTPTLLGAHESGRLGEDSKGIPNNHLPGTWWQIS